ncbi:MULTISPECIES: NAD(P)-dependent malic enzyme [Enterococcus]|uniref:NAD(P)-dependent malic enzyme n=1 Tax=Enterococcus TaxID=1350 RepID=UPI0021CA0043|nr:MULTISPECIES: NADP-dependent malic enzyme [Enterococcus]USO21492.1 NAD(P) binding domain of malic enzyme [Enterococcus casseliflavus]WDA22692.1 NADP-dependent malic enzyme [Enterococcus faecalis]
MNYYQESLKLHKKMQGKISVESKIKVEDNEMLSLIYTPGVAAPCEAIKENKEAVYDYTGKRNTIAVISDGTAVLGLGDIGPEAAIPVMEGKAMLFKQFGGINAVPICLATKDVDEVVQTIKNIAPSFGGINLEDISSPRCFEIERRLDQELDIPVFHDDQHGTAVVVAAGIINAAKLVGKKLESLRVVMNGPGAAGTAITKILLGLGIHDIVVCDEFGILSKETTKEQHKKELAKATNPRAIRGALLEAIQGADVFIGVSVPNVVNERMIQSMNEKPIVFAMANPTPEISYDIAKQQGVAVMGTGRSDTPNQINNLLAFPGIFKGALASRATEITTAMKIAAAYAIAELIAPNQLREEYIIPEILDDRLVAAVSEAVSEAW